MTHDEIMKKGKLMVSAYDALVADYDHRPSAAGAADRDEMRPHAHLWVAMMALSERVELLLTKIAAIEPVGVPAESEVAPDVPPLIEGE